MLDDRECQIMTLTRYQICLEQKYPILYKDINLGKIKTDEAYLLLHTRPTGKPDQKQNKLNSLKCKCGWLMLTSDPKQLHKVYSGTDSRKPFSRKRQHTPKTTFIGTEAVIKKISEHASSRYK